MYGDEDILSGGGPEIGSMQWGDHDPAPSPVPSPAAAPAVASGEPAPDADPAPADEPPAPAPAPVPAPAVADAPKEDGMFAAVRDVLFGKKKDKDSAPAQGGTGDGAGKAAQDGKPAEPPVRAAGKGADGSAETPSPATPPAPGSSGKQEDEIPPELAAHPAYIRMNEDLAAARQSAGRWDGLAGYLSENGVEPQNAQAAIEMAALAAREPEKFYDELVKMTDQYAVALGKRLPGDLQQQVDDGDISEDAAWRIARSEQKAAQESARAERTQSRAAARDRQSNAETAEGVVSRWFAENKDPDLGVKAALITGQFHYLLAQEKTQPDAAGIVRMLNEAHRLVTGAMTAGQALRPRRADPAPNGAARPARSAPVVNDDPMQAAVRKVLMGRAQ